MSLLEYLKLVRPHACPAIVEEGAWERVSRLAEKLPSFDHAGVECRLAPGDERVDVGVNLLPSNDWLRGLRDHPGWRPIASFCDRWTAASGGAGAAVRDLYLEFDLPLERTDELPLPSVFLTLAAHATVEHVEEDLDALRPGGLGADARAHLRRFASAVPTGCRITHVGLMLSRPGAGMRLNVDLADDVAKAALVGAVGWPGDRQAVAQISALAAPDDRVAVGFDLTDRLEPSLGLEYKPGRAERDAPARAAAIANALVAAGLCDPRKASGVARWPGFLRARTAGDAWPAELEWADALLGARAESVLLRSVSHFKLALRPGRPPEAKVYLAYRRRWLDRAEVRRALAPAIEPPSPASAASPA